MTPSSDGRRIERALLVDLDDTLFDHRAAVEGGLELLRRAYPRLGAFPKRALSARYRELLEEIHPAVVRGEITAEESRRRRFLRLFGEAGLALGGREIGRALRIYQEGYRTHRRSVRGARTLLAALRPRWTVVVVTNHVREEQVPKLQELGLAEMIDGLVTFEDAPAPKPDPRPFRLALRIAGVPAARAVVLGDSWESDIRGAIAAGIPAVWLNRDHRPVPRPGVSVLPALVPVVRARQVIERAVPSRR